MNIIFLLRRLVCFLGLFFLFATATSDADEYRFRTWVDSSGQFKIEAQFERIKGNKVVLSKRGGGALEIDLLVLSARDQEYIRLTNRGMEPNVDFDRVAKADPFVIDISKGETIYRHTVKYPWKVDIKKTLVKFVISGNGNREFPSSTKQQQPVNLGKEVKYEIRFAPKSIRQSTSANTSFDLAADVIARMTYDEKQDAFIVFVKPSADVIKGRAGATKIVLSVEQCEKRVAATEGTIQQFTQQIERILPDQIAALERAHGVANSNRLSAFNTNNFQAAGAYATQMNALEVKWKGLINQIKSKRNRIPALKVDQAYLRQISVHLQDLDTITVQYQIFSKVGGNQELILDATINNDQ